MTTLPSQTENFGIYAPPTFTSRDPMFEKYFWMSPYAYCANNPLKYVDPTGMDGVVTGDAADEAVRQWNNMTSSDYKLQLGEDGKISASGAPVSDIDKYLDELIRNSDITVNISASGRNTFPNGDQYDLSVDGVHYYGGAYMGTSIGEDGHVNAYQNVNPYNGKFWDEATNSPNGYCMLHEVAESYEAGKLTKKNGTGDPYKAYGYYDEAHTAAAKYAGGTIDANVIGYNIIHKIKQTPDYLKLIMGSYTVKSKSIPIYEFSFSR